jgi:hypothetical protein
MQIGRVETNFLGQSVTSVPICLFFKQLFKKKILEVTFAPK